MPDPSGSFTWAGQVIPARREVDAWPYRDLRDLEAAIGPRADDGLDRRDIRAAIVVMSIRAAHPDLTIRDIYAGLTVGDVNKAVAELAASLTPPPEASQPADGPGDGSVVLTPSNAAG